MQAVFCWYRTPIDGHERSWLRRAIPDALTVSRVPMALAALVALLIDRPTVAAWLYLIGYLTDVADGFTARALGVGSERGRQLDGAADVAFHALFGLGIAIASIRGGSWWILAVLALLVIAEQVMRRWIAAYTVVGKAVAGLYRVVMFSLLVVLVPTEERLGLIAAGLVVMATTYVYEGRNTLRELRSGERAVR